MMKITKIQQSLSVIGKLKKLDRVKNKHTSLKPIAYSHQFMDFVGNTTYQQQKNNLSPYQQRLIQTKVMERPYTGMLWAQKQTGFYHCAVCNTRLFTFAHKFQTNNGFASFWRSVAGRVNVIDQPVQFEEVNYSRKLMGQTSQKHQRCQCAICKSHLGAVFFDGPPPTFLRFTINSALLKFQLMQDFPDPNIQKKRKTAQQQAKKVQFL